METPVNIKNHALLCIKDEIEALQKLSTYINEDFVKVVQLILESSGRVIITGIGKSAIIAQKIVATLNSTGTPSVFMHAADAIHGDLGIIQPDDLVICISKSGSTPEIKVLIPLIKATGNKLVAIVGNISSELALKSDFVINTTVDKEACPNNLAPTSSTTAQLVMGDALAVALLSSRKFTDRDFSKFHPGGALGKLLYLTAGEIASSNQKPSVETEDSIKTVINEISSKRLGATAVLKNGVLTGIITDGDIRRMLENYDNISGLRAKDIMKSDPLKVVEQTLAVNVAELFKEKKISQVLVTTGAGLYAGMVHLHDLNKEGIL